MKRWLGAGGRKYDDVTQVSKPAVSPTSQSADRPLSGRLRIWKSARQQVWKPALQTTSPNWRPGALRKVRASSRRLLQKFTASPAGGRPSHRVPGMDREA